MKRAVNVLVTLGVVSLIAAAFLWLFLRDTEPKESDPGATDAPVLMMGTGGVEKSITQRLTALYGRAVEAGCPKKVEQTVGTTFDCEVWYADDEETRTVAKVEITGGGGQFEWKTDDAPEKDEDEAEETPAP